MYLQNIKQFAYSEADFHAAGGKGPLPASAATLTTAAGTVAQKSARLAPPQPLSPGPAGTAIATGSAGAASGGGTAGTVAAAYTGTHQTPVYQLPAGPVITSPDRLLTAFTREVILRRPQDFKIAALRDIQRLFPPGQNPFYAGFGNRPTDVQSYRAVGVPDSKIFIINSQGEIRQINHTYRKSYPSINAIVNSMFPAMIEAPITASEVGEQFARPISTDQSFNDVNYWRRSLPPIEDDELPSTKSDAAKKGTGKPAADAKGKPAAAAPKASSVAATPTTKNEGVEAPVAVPIAQSALALK